MGLTLWAYGVVLWEMLTGQRLFTGETVSHVLGAVLQVEPTWDALPAPTSQPLRKLLRRCLEKDRKRRLRDVGAPYPPSQVAKSKVAMVDVG